MRGILGFIIAIVMLIIMVAWLRIEGPKLFNSGFGTLFQFSTSTYLYPIRATSTYSTDTVISPPAPEPYTPPPSTGDSQYRGKVNISSVGVGTYSAVNVTNRAPTSVSLKNWIVIGRLGTVAIPMAESGVVLLAPGDVVAIHNGFRSENAIQAYPNAKWHVWLGTAFIQNHDTLILRDAIAGDVATYTY